MSRFEDVTEEVYNVLKEVKDAHFPVLAGASIKVLFDVKKRTSGGKMVMGRIQKTNDLLRHLTVEESDNEDGFDYIMYLDKKIWDNIEKIDRVRLVRHELRHTLVDLDTSGNPFKIVPHDIEDFAEELMLNEDDIKWAERVGELGLHLYEQERESNS